jgi:hypothetical protein
MPGNYPEESKQHSEHGENLNSRINTFLVQQPFPEIRPVYEIKWRNIVKPDRSQMTK